MKKFYREHKGISIGFGMSLTIVLLYLISMNKEEFWVGAEKWFNVAFQVGVGYIINFVFYITQVYLPQIEDEEKAFLAIKANMNSLIIILCNLYDKVRDFVIIKDDKVDYKRGNIYFTNDNEENTNFDYMNIDEKFRYYKTKINDYIDEIVNNVSFYSCSKDIIACISELQSNEFLNKLEIISNIPDNLYKITKYDGLDKSYKEFIHIYKEVLKYEQKHKENSYRELTDGEKQEYFLLRDKIYKYEKEVIDSNIKAEAVYRGGIRIK